MQLDTRVRLKRAFRLGGGKIWKTGQTGRVVKSVNGVAGLDDGHYTVRLDVPEQQLIRIREADIPFMLKLVRLLNSIQWQR